MKYSIIIFDWDGTLVNSENHIVSSIQFAAEQLGWMVLEYDQVKQIIGLGMTEAIKALYPGVDGAGIVDFKAHYSQYFFSQPVDRHCLFPDVIKVLDHFKQQDMTLAVATGKSRPGLEKALDSTRLRDYFAMTRCADETRSKPDPLMLQQILDHYKLEPRQALMVGDTEFDMEMAHRLGMDAVAMTYGVHEADRLKKYHPELLLDKMDGLIEFVEQSTGSKD